MNNNHKADVPNQASQWQTDTNTSKDNTPNKKHIKPDSPAKEEQNRFIDEGGNSQVLKDGNTLKSK